MPCVLVDAEDHTGAVALTVVSSGIRYTPRCARVSVGTTITFESDFVTHPLGGGAVVGGVAMPDPESPITPTTTGTTVTFDFTEVGEFPYFCDRHASIGMFGTIWVE